MNHYLGLAGGVVQLGKYIREALAEGYTIEHVGLLVECPVPTAASMPIVRLLMIAGKAALSSTFRAMRSATKDYGMTDFYTWGRELFDYGGLCSHSALMESVASDFDLTDEQRETLHNEWKEKERVRGLNKYYAKKNGDPEAWKALKQREKDKRATAEWQAVRKAYRARPETKALRKITNKRYDDSEKGKTNKIAKQKA